MIAKLNNSNNDKCRHRWSKQKIHRSSSFPKKMGMTLQLVFDNYSWNQADTPCQIPHGVLMNSVIASPLPTLKWQEIPIFVNSSDFGSAKCAENRSPEAKRLPIGQMLFHLNVQSLTRSAPLPHKVSFFS
jgi:hypothetical protein